MTIHRRDLVDYEPDAIDRVQVLSDLVGPLEPNLREPLPGDPVKAIKLWQQSRAVYSAERMQACCEVVSVRRVMVSRDVSDECGCRECAA